MECAENETRSIHIGCLQEVLSNALEFGIWMNEHISDSLHLLFYKEALETLHPSIMEELEAQQDIWFFSQKHLPP